jgi:tetratricopeptide (TPR) repeat protein
MGRPERPLDPAAGPAVCFALELRRMRRRAGSPPYRDLARLARFSASTLSAAASGQSLPSKEVTLAFASACGEDPSLWERRWREAAASVMGMQTQDRFAGPGPLGGPRCPLGDAEAHVAPAASNRGWRSMLPADVTDFTGRENELQQAVSELFGDPADAEARAAQVLTIAGPPGIGKTAFALHLAHRIKDRFPDGHLFLDLRASQDRPREPCEALASLLRTLDVPVPSAMTQLGELSALFRAALADKRALMVLDNAFSEAQVRPLLPASPGCCTLITSRILLPGLEGAKSVLLDVFTKDEALELLARIVGFRRVCEDPSATTEVAASSGLFPLTIRIAGARLAARPAWTVAQFAKRLHDERSRLNELTVGDLGIRAAFALSYQSLKPPDQRVFRLLGLIPGRDISLEGAAALTGLRMAESEEILERLVDVSLAQTTCGMHRYSMHDLIRLYATERAEEEESPAARTEALNQLFNWYLYSADAADRALVPKRRRHLLEPPQFDWCPPTFREYREALEWCDAEHANLVAVTREAHRIGHYGIAWKLPVALWGYFTFSKRWSDWGAILRIGLASALRIDDRAGEAWSLGSLGFACGNVGRSDEAVGFLQRALVIARECGDEWGEGILLTGLALTYKGGGRLEEAVDCLQRVLVVCRKAEDRWGEGYALNILGGVYRDMRRLADAIECVEIALSIFRDMHNRLAEAQALSSLSQIHLSAGDPENGIDCLWQELAIRQDLGDVRGQGETLGILGEVLRGTGEHITAQRCSAQSLAIFERTGDKRA